MTIGRREFITLLGGAGAAGRADAAVTSPASSVRMGPVIAHEHHSAIQ
jgi:hypothetical protein